MLRIMIADDEYLVIESFKHIVERYTDGVEIVATASSGREAIELAERFRPDLIFMDIRMPGINGMEAIRSIRENNKVVQFVIISAYEQFNFAREGIGLGVLEYLTKPFGKEQIIELVEKVKRQLDEKRQALNREVVLKERLNKILPFIENQLIYSYLYHGVKFEEIEFYEDLFGVNLEQGYVVVALSSHDITGDLEKSLAYSLERQKLLNDFSYEVKTRLHGLAGPAFLDRVVIYVPVDPERNPYDVRNDSLEILSDISELLSSKVTVPYQIGIGKIYAIKQMYTSYKEAMAACSLAPSETVIHIEDVTTAEDGRISYNVNYKERLASYYLKGDSSGLENLIDECLSELMEQTDSIQHIKAKLMELIISVKKADPRKDFGTDSEDDEFLHRFIDATQVSDLKKILYDYLFAEMKENATKKESTHHGVIAKAMSYIDQNYSNNISLNDVAESINMSYFYFSRLFKESTGKSFSDYLTEYRIDKSIELMRDEQLSIKQISYDIGYNDPNYFSKIFKKLKGITPTDYRGRMGL